MEKREQRERVMRRLSEIYVTYRQRYILCLPQGKIVTPKNKKGEYSRLTDGVMRKHVEHAYAVGVFAGKWGSRFICFDVDDGDRNTVRRIVGLLSALGIPEDEFGVSLIGEARIPKRNAKLCETIRQMYASGKLMFSFEIMATVISEVDGAMVIDAAEGNELIGMAIVSVPAYPEATALKLIAEEQKEEDDMEVEKKLAEAEARLKLAEEKNQEDKETLKQKDEELSAEKKKCEEAEAALTSAQNTVAEKETRIAELEAQVAELTPYKAEAETLKAEKAAAELAAKKQELTAFAEAQGLDVKNETVAAAIEAVDYAALVAETMKLEKKPEAKPTLAAYAMGGGMNLSGDYGDLLGKA